MLKCLSASAPTHLISVLKLAAPFLDNVMQFQAYSIDCHVALVSGHSQFALHASSVPLPAGARGSVWSCNSRQMGAVLGVVLLAHMLFSFLCDHRGSARRNATHGPGC